MRTLLIEDDLVLREALQAGLRRAGFAVDALGSAEPADLAMRTTQYDLLILDVGLPGISGLAFLRHLRLRCAGLPVLMLTGSDRLEDCVQGLSQGADDYLVKPCPMPELIARCRALVRRSRAAASSFIDFGALSLDLAERRVRAHGQLLELTRREKGLLEQLMLNAPRLVFKQKLVDSLSTWDREITVNAIEIYASRVRAKLASTGVTLRTVRGLGYRLELDESVCGAAR